ncbi:hypothetical protein [Nakamurella deserti]|uniref:hypothetical protein n=1 Tax=Nakamurella deserti TaxID=2164074 RepID=UPI000DBE8D82|nr:hypothetical protein [Nakamurella deserti]
MSIRRLAAVTLVTATAGLSSLMLVQSASAAPTVTGTACGVNEGVTVVVDFAPAEDELVVGCAAGPQESLGDAMEAAGFEVTTQDFSGPYLCAIDGVAANADDCFAFPGPYWSSWLSNAEGQPAGAPTDEWAFAQVGLSGGPVGVGSTIGYSLSDGTTSAPPRLDLTALPARDNTPVEVPAYGPAQGSATAVAGWIGRQLEAGDGLINGSPGLTVDAVYALAAAGVGGDTIDRSAAALLASGSAYVGTAAEAPAKFAQIAKFALALQIAGVDTAAFPDGAGGTRDLLGELRSTLNADGSFGTADDPFRHAYALIALSRTEAGAPATALSWLAAQQCAEGANAGGFGYDADPCTSADPDYTALAVEGLLAGGLTGDDATVATATAWLSAQQGTAGDLGGNTNSTGLGGNAFAAVGAADAATAAAGFIGGLQVTCDTLVDTALTPAEVGAIAWTPAGLADAAEFGLDEGNLGEWQYASVQAVLGLGTPALADLTAAGAEDALPAAATCEAPVTEPTDPTSEPVVPTTEPVAPTTEPVAPTTSAQPTTASAAAPVTTSTTPSTTRTPVKTTAPALASTGVTDRTGTELGIAALLLVAGAGLVVAGRRTRAPRRH